MKVCITLFLTLSLAVALCGCTNNGGNVTKPTPTLGPIGSLLPSTSPKSTAPNSSLTPSASAVASESPEMSDTPDATDIPDFSEGTVVDPDQLPEIVAAVTAKYPGVTVMSITHALHLGSQVYEVVYKESSGSTKTVYVSPDAKTITES